MIINNTSFKWSLKIFGLIIGLAGMSHRVYANLEETKNKIITCGKSNTTIEGTDSDIRALAHKICKDMDVVSSKSSHCQSAVEECSVDVYDRIWSLLEATCKEEYPSFNCQTCNYFYTIDTVERGALSQYKDSIAKACQCGNGQLDPGEACDPKGFSSIIPFQKCGRSCTLTFVTSSDSSGAARQKDPAEPALDPMSPVSLGAADQTISNDRGNGGVAEKIDPEMSSGGCSMIQMKGRVSFLSGGGLTFCLPAFFYPLLRKKRSAVDAFEP